MAKTRVVSPQGQPKEGPQGRSDPTGLVEQVDDVLSRARKEGLDLSREGLEREGSKGSGPRDRSYRQRRRPGPKPKLKWGRIGGAGLALSIANPFGWNIGIPPIRLAPITGPGVYGRDEGLICYTSACTPTIGPVGVEAHNVCASAFPHCPFGTVGEPTGMRSSYLESWTLDYAQNPFYEYAVIYYIKGGIAPGYYSHEVQQVLNGTDVGIRPFPLLMVEADIAPFTMQPSNLNERPNQKPDPREEAKPKPDAKTETKPDGKRRVTTFSKGSVKREPPRWPGVVPPQRPGPGVKERKLQFGSLAAYRAVMGAIDAITETQDFVRALYDGLPCSTRVGSWRSGPAGGRYFKRGEGKCGKYDTDCQGKAIERHWNEMDWENALLNVLANQLQDAAIGMSDRYLENQMNARGKWNNYAKFKGLQREIRTLTDRVAAEKRKRGMGSGACV